MRSFIVVNLDEGIEALLLLQEIERSGLGGILLQCQMHALVTAVLLWVAGLDALDLDQKTRARSGEAYVMCLLNLYNAPDSTERENCEIT